MADLKKRILYFSSGKQIKLFGNSIAISKSLEIGEGYAPNLLSLVEEQPDNNVSAGLSNPYRLTAEELMELADFEMQLWMDLKAGVRRSGKVDIGIFGQENTPKTPSTDSEKPEKIRKRKASEKGKEPEKGKDSEKGKASEKENE